MKYTLAIAAMLVAGVSTSAFAEGHVAQSQLAELGLPGLTVLSDAQGSEIRGQGFVYASSSSAAAVPGARNRSSVTAIGHNFAGAASGASAEASIEGAFAFGRGRHHSVRGYFSLSVSASSSGYAIGAAH